MAFRYFAAGLASQTRLGQNFFRRAPSSVTPVMRFLSSGPRPRPRPHIKQISAKEYEGGRRPFPEMKVTDEDRR